MVNACKTQTNTVTSSDKSSSMEHVETKNSECPDGGTCTVEIHNNKKLVVKEDGIGARYTQMEPGNNLVVEYTYSKEGPKGTVDGNYSETIQFEIPMATDNLSKTDTSLKDVNLVYTKQCFCRGEAGAYTIDQGKLLLEKTNNALTFDLQFKVGKTSQVVSHISEMVKL